MKEKTPFRYTIEPIGDTLAVEYVGDLAESDVEHVKQLSAFLERSPSTLGLCFNVAAFGGFHRSQIAMHVDLFRQQGKKIRGIAVVGASPGAHFAAITVGLMANMPLKSFSERKEGLDWLSTLKSPAPRR